MKTVSKLVLALVATASCGLAVAQSDLSDQQRRERNREEAIAKWEQQRSGATAQRDDGGIGVNKSVQENTQHVAKKTSSFTHRQLQKMRRFGARQEARHPGPAVPARESNKAPAALGK
jgi:hypothetical protein